MVRKFIFATGIENSIPVINNGRKRIDEMEKCRDYQFGQHDRDLVQEMGIQFLRYGPPLHKTFLSPQKYDWSFTNEVLTISGKNK